MGCAIWRSFTKFYQNSNVFKRFWDIKKIVFSHFPSYLELYLKTGIVVATFYLLWGTANKISVLRFNIWAEITYNPWMIVLFRTISTVEIENTLHTIQKLQSITNFQNFNYCGFQTSTNQFYPQNSPFLMGQPFLT